MVGPEGSVDYIISPVGKRYFLLYCPHLRQDVAEEKPELRLLFTEAVVKGRTKRLELLRGHVHLFDGEEEVLLAAVPWVVACDATVHFRQLAQELRCNVFFQDGDMDRPVLKSYDAEPRYAFTMDDVDSVDSYSWVFHLSEEAQKLELEPLT
jgi:hypothetical protein